MGRDRSEAALKDALKLQTEETKPFQSEFRFVLMLYLNFNQCFINQLLGFDHKK